MKNFLLFIILIYLTPLLCGCTDAQEIDKSAYVIALGIDKGKKDYNYTFQISSPLAMGGGGEVGNTENGEKNTRVENIIINSGSLSEARTILNNFLSKKINLSHLKIIVFSEDIARAGLSPHIPFLLLEREVRPNTRLAISSGTAEAFLKGINPALEANTAEYYELVFDNGGSFAPSKTLWEFVNEQETYASALPCGIISELSDSKSFSKRNVSNRISTSKSEFSGLYLIKNYRLCGTLTPSQSQLFALLSGKIKDLELTISNRTVKITLTENPKFRLRQSETEPSFSIIATFSAELKGSYKHIPALVIENHLEKTLISLFNTLKKENCDIFNIGNSLKTECKTIREWENLQWNKNFREVFFIPKVSVIISKSDSSPL